MDRCKCGNSLSGFKSCDDCLRKAREKRYERRAWLKSQNMCRCGRDRNPEHAICDFCRESNRNKYRANVDAGKCADCGKTTGGARCDICLEKRNNARNEMRKTDWKLRKLCHSCGGENTTGQSICKKCAEDQKSYRDENKRQVIAAYGGVCNCCGENEFLLLTIDHINNDGSFERKQDPYSYGNKLYRKIIREGFPPIYQVLCWNCNVGKYLNKGVCPHKISLRDVLSGSSVG